MRGKIVHGVRIVYADKTTQLIHFEFPIVIKNNETIEFVESEIE